MNNTIGQRLKLFIESKNILQENVAEIIKVPKQQVSSWTTGTTNITTKYLPVLLKAFPELNARWLLTGEEEQVKAPGIGLINEPTSPYITECTNPICVEKIKSLNEMINELRADKKFLQEQLQRKVEPPENKVTGGVGKSYSKTG